MPEDIGTAFNSLSEQAKQMNLATFFCNGDADKAKKMINGTYKDIFAIKAVFSSSTMYGALLFFYNASYLKLLDSYMIITPSYQVDNISSNQEWKIFEKEIKEAKDKYEKDATYSGQIRDGIISGFELTLCKELSSFIEKNDDISINHFFQKLLQDKAALQRVNISVDMQNISSLEMELYSTSSRKIDLNAINKTEKKSEKKDQSEQVAASPDEEPQVGKDGIKLVLNCSLILSPVKGKHISQVGVGDHVMISIVDKNPKGVDVAKALKAYDEENNVIKPIGARIKNIKFVDGEGYKVYALIANGIIAKILEEETNIKVSMDPKYQIVSQEEALKKSGVNIPVLIFSIVVIIIVVALVIINLI